MKEIWLKLDKYDKKLVTTAIESGLDGVFIDDLEEDGLREIRRLGFIKIGSFSKLENLDLLLDRESMLVIEGEEDLKRARELGRTRDIVVVDSRDWKIIPLENLVAEFQSLPARLFSIARSSEEAETMLGVLEVGVDGVMLETKNIGEIKRCSRLKEIVGEIELVPVEIMSIKNLGLGDRVCVDTCSLMGIGEGMLVGSSSSFLFLVHSESLESRYVASRPFRVNAGSVHSYTLLPDGRTKYLSELKAGDEVLIVDRSGKARRAFVGRVKIERRPMILVEARSDSGKSGSIILQNAETIRLVREDGEPVSVTELRPGDRVLAAVESEEIGRHFGIRVRESVIER